MGNIKTLSKIIYLKASDTVNRLIYILSRSRFSIPALVFVGYFVLSLGVNGPAYMTDEIAYLNKASVITGNTVHMTTSWFGGYSFLIAPAFLLSSDPYVIWTLIMGLNALMWAGSAALLGYILRRTHPKMSDKTVWLATIGAMLYPSWLSMSGYAFATSGFVLVFMASLALLLRSNLTQSGWLALSGLLAGYLCWIHPLGFLYLGLFFGVVMLQTVLKKSWIHGVIAAGCLLFAVTYVMVVHPWFNSVMSGSVVNDAHYTSGLAGLLSALTTGDYWLRAIGLTIGLSFFTLVATFGLFVYGSLGPLQEIRQKVKNPRQLLQNTRLIIMIIPALLIVAVILFTALTWANTSHLRIDQWVYGRYTDMYLLPVIGFGLLAAWKLKHGLVVAGLVVVGGIALTLLTNPGNTGFFFNNKVNIQGLWPMHLASVLHANHYWLWGLLGALGIMYVALLGNGRKKVYLTLLLVPIALTGASNYIYNLTITKQHATVSGLYQYIKTNYSTSDCIGFTPQPDNHERFNLYTYYLQGYNLKRIPIEQWQQEGCTGPYLTYDVASANKLGLKVAGMEQKTGLYVFVHPAHSVALTDKRITF